MIGANCSKALEPYELVHSVGEGPFAYRTLLGWCVVGASGEPADQSSKCFYTHVRVQVNDVATSKPASHYFKLSSNVIDNSISDALQAMYSTEFSERFVESKALSVDDKRFLQRFEAVSRLCGQPTGESSPIL